MTPPDPRFMDHALALAGRGLGRVWPNPAVGCVIERGGIILGRGRTADGGRPHAETAALAEAGAAARGATAYVTLEPCAHHGRTPPCAEALAAAGIARVVVAARDPDPRVDGGGIARLRAAGIAVVEDMRRDAAEDLQRGFLLRVTRGRPMVTLKLAMTLDGRIATGGGESKWITGPAARAHVHAERARHDAVLVGAGTVRADDPRLTVRGMGRAHAEGIQPVRVVMSRGLDLPLPSALLGGDGPPVWLLHAAQASAKGRRRLEGGNRTLISVPKAGNGGIDPGAALQALGDRGLTRVYCEGGGALAASLLSAGLVDRLDCYTAGALIGAEGTPGIGPIGLAALRDAPRLRLAETRRLGSDLLHRWRAD